MKNVRKQISKVKSESSIYQGGVTSEAPVLHRSTSTVETISKNTLSLVSDVEKTTVLEENWTKAKSCHSEDCDSYKGAVGSKIECKEACSFVPLSDTFSSERVDNSDAEKWLSIFAEKESCSPRCKLKKLKPVAGNISSELRKIFIKNKKVEKTKLISNECNTYLGKSTLKSGKCLFHERSSFPRGKQPDTKSPVSNLAPKIYNSIITSWNPHSRRIISLKRQTVSLEFEQCQNCDKKLKSILLSPPYLENNSTAHKQSSCTRQCKSFGKIKEIRQNKINVKQSSSQNFPVCKVITTKDVTPEIVKPGRMVGPFHTKNRKFRNRRESHLNEESTKLKRCQIVKKTRSCLCSFCPHKLKHGKVCVDQRWRSWSLPSSKTLICHKSRRNKLFKSLSSKPISSRLCDDLGKLVKHDKDRNDRKRKRIKNATESTTSFDKLQLAKRLKPLFSSAMAQLLQGRQTLDVSDNSSYLFGPWENKSENDIIDEKDDFCIGDNFHPDFTGSSEMELSSIKDEDFDNSPMVVNDTGNHDESISASCSSVIGSTSCSQSSCYSSAKDTEDSGNSESGSGSGDPSNCDYSDNGSDCGVTGTSNSVYDQTQSSRVSSLQSTTEYNEISSSSSSSDDSRSERDDRAHKGLELCDYGSSQEHSGNKDEGVLCNEGKCSKSDSLQAKSVTNEGDEEEQRPRRTVREMVKCLDEKAVSSTQSCATCGKSSCLRASGSISITTSSTTGDQHAVGRSKGFSKAIDDTKQEQILKDASIPPSASPPRRPINDKDIAEVQNDDYFDKIKPCPDLLSTANPEEYTMNDTIEYTCNVDCNAENSCATAELNKGIKGNLTNWQTNDPSRLCMIAEAVAKADIAAYGVAIDTFESFLSGEEETLDSNVTSCTQVQNLNEEQGGHTRPACSEVNSTKDLSPVSQGTKSTEIQKAVNFEPGNECCVDTVSDVEDSMAGGFYSRNRENAYPTPRPRRSRINSKDCEVTIFKPSTIIKRPAEITNTEQQSQSSSFEALSSSQDTTVAGDNSPEKLCVEVTLATPHRGAPDPNFTSGEITNMLGQENKETPSNDERIDVLHETNVPFCYDDKIIEISFHSELTESEFSDDLCEETKLKEGINRETNAQNLGESTEPVHCVFEKARQVLKKLRSKSLGPADVCTRVDNIIEKGKASISKIIRSLSSTDIKSCNQHSSQNIDCAVDNQHCIPSQENENMLTAQSTSSDLSTIQGDCHDPIYVLYVPESNSLKRKEANSLNSYRRLVVSQRELNSDVLIKPDLVEQEIHKQSDESISLVKREEGYASAKSPPPLDEELNLRGSCLPKPARAAMVETNPKRITDIQSSLSIRMRSPILESSLETESKSENSGNYSWCQAFEESKVPSEIICIADMPCENDDSDLNNILSNALISDSKSKRCLLGSEVQRQTNYNFDEHKDALIEDLSMSSDGTIYPAEIPTRASLSDCIPQKRHELDHTSNPEDGTGVLPLAPVKTQSLVNTSETGLSECGMTDMMALISQEASIKRYPSYPDLTDINNDENIEMTGESLTAIQAIENIDEGYDEVNLEAINVAQLLSNEMPATAKDMKVISIETSDPNAAADRSDANGMNETPDFSLKEAQKFETHIDVGLTEFGIGTSKSSLASPPCNPTCVLQYPESHNCSPVMGAQDTDGKVSTIVSLMESCKLLHDGDDVRAEVLCCCGGEEGKTGNLAHSGDGTEMKLTQPQDVALCGAFCQENSTLPSSIQLEEDIFSSLYPQTENYILDLPSPPSRSPGMDSPRMSPLQQCDEKLHNVGDIGCFSHTSHEGTHNLGEKFASVSSGVEIGYEQIDLYKNKHIYECAADEGSFKDMQTPLTVNLNSQEKIEMISINSKEEENTSHLEGFEPTCDCKEKDQIVNQADSSVTKSSSSLGGPINPAETCDVHCTEDKDSSLAEIQAISAYSSRKSSVDNQLGNENDTVLANDCVSLFKHFEAGRRDSLSHYSSEESELLSLNPSLDSICLYDVKNSNHEIRFQIEDHESIKHCSSSLCNKSFDDDWKGPDQFMAKLTNKCDSSSESDSEEKFKRIHFSLEGSNCDISLNSQSRSYRSTDSERSSGAGEQLALTAEGEVKRSKKKTKNFLSGEGPSKVIAGTISPRRRGSGSGVNSRTLSTTSSPEPQENEAKKSQLPKAECSQKPKIPRAALTQRTGKARQVKKEIKWDDDISCEDSYEVSTQSSSEMISDKCNSCVSAKSKGNVIECNHRKQAEASTEPPTLWKILNTKTSAGYSYNAKVLPSPPLRAKCHYYNPRTYINKSGRPYSRKMSALARVSRVTPSQNHQDGPVSTYDVGRHDSRGGFQIKPEQHLSSAPVEPDRKATEIGAGVSHVAGEETKNKNNPSKTRMPHNKRNQTRYEQQGNNNNAQDLYLVGSTSKTDNTIEGTSAEPDEDCNNRISPSSTSACGVNPITMKTSTHLHNLPFGESISASNNNYAPNTTFGSYDPIPNRFISAPSQTCQQVMGQANLLRSNSFSTISHSSFTSLNGEHDLSINCISPLCDHLMNVSSLPLVSLAEKNLRQSENNIATSLSTKDFSRSSETLECNRQNPHNQLAAISRLTRRLRGSEVSLRKAVDFVSRSQNHIRKCDFLIGRSSEIIRRSEEMLSVSRQQIKNTAQCMSLMSCGSDPAL